MLLCCYVVVAVAVMLVVTSLPAQAAACHTGQCVAFYAACCDGVVDSGGFGASKKHSCAGSSVSHRPVGLLLAVENAAVVVLLLCLW